MEIHSELLQYIRCLCYKGDELRTFLTAEMYGARCPCVHNYRGRGNQHNHGLGFWLLSRHELPAWRHFCPPCQALWMPNWLEQDVLRCELNSYLFSYGYTAILSHLICKLNAFCWTYFGLKSWLWWVFQLISIFVLWFNRHLVYKLKDTPAITLPIQCI